MLLIINKLNLHKSQSEYLISLQKSNSLRKKPELLIKKLKNY